MIIEAQNTTTDGKTVSGELTIRFTDLPTETFLKYRAMIRSIQRVDSVNIEAASLTNGNQLEKHPDSHTPEKPPRVVEKKTKRGYLSSKAKAFLKRQIGKDAGTIVKEYRRHFKCRDMTDSDILALFNRANNITENKTTGLDALFDQRIEA